MNNGALRVSAVLDRNHVPTAAELYFRVYQWLCAQSQPTAEQVRDHFQVNRATAYRWVAAYKATQGIA